MRDPPRSPILAEQLRSWCLLGRRSVVDYQGLLELICTRCGAVRKTPPRTPMLEAQLEMQFFCSGLWKSGIVRRSATSTVCKSLRRVCAGSLSHCCCLERKSKCFVRGSSSTTNYSPAVCEMVLASGLFFNYSALSSLDVFFLGRLLSNHPTTSVSSVKFLLSHLITEARRAVLYLAEGGQPIRRRIPRLAQSSLEESRRTRGVRVMIRRKVNNPSQQVVPSPDLFLSIQIFSKAQSCTVKRTVLSFHN